MARKVYLIKRLCYKPNTNTFEFWDMDIYTNKVNRDWFINQEISINKGIEIKREQGILEDHETITYKALNIGDNRYFKTRIVTETKELK